MREWTEVGFSSIYYLLKKLEKNGLIQSHTEQSVGRGPARKTYTITTAGQTACLEESRKALAGPHRFYSPFYLGLANLPGLATTDVLTALTENRDALAARLANIDAQEAHQQPIPPTAKAMFDYSRTMIEAEIGWIERFMTQLEAEE